VKGQRVQPADRDGAHLDEEDGARGVAIGRRNEQQGAADGEQRERRRGEAQQETRSRPRDELRHEAKKPQIEQKDRAEEERDADEVNPLERCVEIRSQLDPGGEIAARELQPERSVDRILREHGVTGLPSARTRT
jgi:hypothetical protein